MVTTRFLFAVCPSARRRAAILAEQRLSYSDLSPGIAGRWAYDFRSAELNNDAARGSMSTFLSHAGLRNQIDGNEPLSPPIELATTYERPPDGNYDLEGGRGGKIYARTHNPTREALENFVAEAEVLVPRRRRRRREDRLEGPAECGSSGLSGKGDAPPKEDSPAVQSQPPLPVCAAFSSGMAAVSAILLSLSSPVCVVLPDDVYHGVPTALLSVFQRHGVQWSAVDMSDAVAVTEAIADSVRKIEGTGAGAGDVLVWIETPSNPLCKVTDIRALCELVNRMRDDRGGRDFGINITTVVDSTWAPPPITQPLLLGSDAVLHSATKYLGGHSDALVGIVSASSSTPSGRRLGSSLKAVQFATGSVSSPFDSWLVLRGMRTLDVRLQRQCSNALVLADFLSSYPGVERVHYPGLTSHPDHGVAARQMCDGMYGGMLSFEVADDIRAMAVAGAVRTLRRATSLGGTETLIEHRASIEPEGRRTSPPGLLRVSSGLEDADDLMDDLDEALRVKERVFLKEAATAPRG